ncbi:15724_t:CDS:2, partial [Racocetra fulgida]
MGERSNFLPSTDHLSALAKGRIPENTIKNTERWIKIMNQWRLDVNYNEPLESLNKEIIELQVSQFLCGVTPKKGGSYSRTSLKNALSAISRHLQDVKPGWKYNLHNKNDFPDLYAQFDGLLKDMKKKGLGESKSTDSLTTEEIRHILNHEVLDPNTPLGLLKRVFFWISILGAARGGEHVNLHLQQIVDMPNGIIFRKNQQKNDQGGIDRNQYDLIIPFRPNSDLRKYLSFRPENSKCSNYYLATCRSPNAIVKGKWYLDKLLADRTIRSLFKMICVECGINIESRNINNHSGRRTSIIELFSIGVSENTGRAISGHKSSGGYYAYAKPTDNHKREALASILNKIITTSSTETSQELIKDSNSEADNYEDLQDDTSESDNYVSDEDLNASAQEPNEHKLYGDFHTAKELLKNNSKSHKRTLNIT